MILHTNDGKMGYFKNGAFHEVSYMNQVSHEIIPGNTLIFHHSGKYYTLDELYDKVHK